MNNRPTSVLITSDHEVVCIGLAAILQSDPRFECRVGAVDELLLSGADVVLYDVIGLVDNDGSEFDRLVKETDVAVLAVTRDLRPDLADLALAKGADGCVSLDAGAQELAAAVEAAAWGDLTGDSSPDAVDFTVNPAYDASDLPHLAPREAEVLRLIAAGLSNADIAGQLYLSINSVKTYIRGAYRRIDVQTRSQAVAWALQHGLGHSSPTQP
ncbi:response regulator transcription factor [soil metagenome]